MRAWLAILLLAAFDAGARQSVTFVLGDRQGSAFFDGAALHYATVAETTLVTSARSLADVREFLARSPLRGAQPWGEVRLVAHGSEWYGLRVPIFASGENAGGEMARLTALERAHDSGAFPTLPVTVLDRESRIAIESCGIGRRPALLRAVARLFADSTASAIAARDYVEFRSPVDAPRGAPERREIAYVSRVEPGASGDRDVEARLRAQWRRERGSEARGLERRTVPVALRFPLAAGGAALPPAAVPAVRATLHDLGLDVRDLAWRASGGSLVGEARIEVLAPPLAGDLFSSDTSVPAL